MVMFEQVLADMRERAAVARDAAKNNPDGTVHHEAVADMLEYLAARAEEAHNREIDAIAAQKTAEAHEAFVKNAELADAIAVKDAEIEDLKKENARLRVINCGSYYADCNLREEIERLRGIVKELADELETMICNEIVKSSKRHGK